MNPIGSARSCQNSLVQPLKRLRSTVTVRPVVLLKYRRPLSLGPSPFKQRNLKGDLKGGFRGLKGEGLRLKGYLKGLKGAKGLRRRPEGAGRIQRQIDSTLHLQKA